MGNLDSTIKTVSELIYDFERGDIAVPEIQRDVIWKSDQVKSLIDSVINGFPCGSLIIWEPNRKDASLIKSIIRPERLENFKSLPTYLLLDGQQRLTSLASVMMDRNILRKILSEIEEDLPFIFINLKNFPNEIEASATNIGYKYPWVLFNKLFDDSLNNNDSYRKMEIKKKEKIRKIVQDIRDYKFPVQIIRNQTYETIAEIFTRVNSQGTQLSGAEIHLARIVPYWRGITKEFRNYRKDLRKEYYDLDLNLLMRLVTSIVTDIPQIKRLSDKIKKDKIPIKTLNSNWREVKSSTNNLIKILKTDLLLDKSKYFISKNSLVPLVYYIAKEKSKLNKIGIKKFFILSQLSQHYGGATETALRKDFKALKEVTKNRTGLNELVKNVLYESKREYRGLKIKSDHVSGIPSKNVILLLMYVIMRKNNAYDWKYNGKLFDDIEPENIQLHHIFPFELMINDKKVFQKYENEGNSWSNYKSEINDIANITFLTKNTNQSIGDNPPSLYLQNYTDKKNRKAHMIPENPNLWKSENFFKFLKERRMIIANSLSNFLNSYKK